MDLGVYVSEQVLAGDLPCAGDTPLDDLDASSLLSYSHSELSFADSQSTASGTKPWFIRKLPFRLELVEVCYLCRFLQE